MTADGISTTTLTVTVEDAHSNPVAHTAVTLSDSGSANSFGAISGTTNASGVFTTTLASTLVQNETITATEGSVSEHTSVSFVASATVPVVTKNPDGTIHDIHYYGITGQAYTDYDVVYGANNQPASASYSNGMTETWTYNLDNTVDAIVYNATGSRGADTVHAGGGNITFNGNGEHDTIIFAGSSSQYTVVNNGDGSVTTTDSVTGRDGSDHLLGVEFLQFTDETIFVENSDNAAIARLYSAALNRAPDVNGLSGWEDIYANNISAAAKAGGIYLALAQTNCGFGTSIAGGFVQSVEFQSKYGNLDNSGFVTELYLNVLNRTPAPSELNAWLGLIHNGGYTHDMVLVGFAESPENIAKTAGWLIYV